jgi:hypothetical protein
MGIGHGGRFRRRWTRDALVEANEAGRLRRLRRHPAPKRRRVAGLRASPIGTGACRRSPQRKAVGSAPANCAGGPAGRSNGYANDAGDIGSKAAAANRQVRYRLQEGHGRSG